MCSEMRLMRTTSECRLPRMRASTAAMSGAARRWMAAKAAGASVKACANYSGPVGGALAPMLLECLESIGTEAPPTTASARGEQPPPMRHHVDRAAHGRMRRRVAVDEVDLHRARLRRQLDLDAAAP